MLEPDQEKTAFITPHGSFCYKVMHAPWAYQRMITKMFKLLMGKTMDAYIDDMLVESKK